MTTEVEVEVTAPEVEEVTEMIVEEVEEVIEAIEEVEEIFEERVEVDRSAGPGAPKGFFERKRRGHAVLRSGGKTHVIDLDGLPSSGVIEVDGKMFRYERTDAPKPPKPPKAPKGPKAPTKSKTKARFLEVEDAVEEVAPQVEKARPTRVRSVRRTVRTPGDQ